MKSHKNKSLLRSGEKPLLKRAVEAVVFVLCLTQIGEAKAACTNNQTCGANCCWEFSDGTLKITGSGAMNDYGIHGNGPGGFANTAPWRNLNIKSIDIQGINRIGFGAFFQLPTVTSVNIGNTVTYIGEQAFNAYNGASGMKLQTLVLPDSLTGIGGYALSNTSISQIIVTDSMKLTSIGESSLGWKTLFCKGNLATCKNMFKNYKIVGGKAYNLNIIPATEALCNSEKYYYTGSSCDKIPTDLSKMTCNNGYVLDETAHRCDRHGCASFADGACTCDKYYYKKEGGCVSFEEGCGSGWLEKNRECIEASKGCGDGYKDLGGWCNRVIYTPAEAAPLLTDESNTVTITFKK